MFKYVFKTSTVFKSDYFRQSVGPLWEREKEGIKLPNYLDAALFISRRDHHVQLTQTKPQKGVYLTIPCIDNYAYGPSSLTGTNLTHKSGLYHIACTLKSLLKSLSRPRTPSMSKNQSTLATNNFVWCQAISRPVHILGPMPNG